LYDVPEYSIRLTHDAGWNASTGYNDLMHILTVTANSSTSACTDVFDLREVPVITNILSTATPDITIYPNPINNFFVIKGTLTSYHIEIIDALGNVHQTMTGANTIVINTSTLPAGMYFVRITHNTLGEVCVQKIIKP